MFRKKLLAMGLIITIALCGLSGCTGNTTTAPQETTTPEVTTGQEETSTEEKETTTEKSTSEEETVGGVMGYVDAEDICKHISINGKVVEFPWTLNELGEEYTFSENTEVDLETGNGAAWLMYKGQMIDLVQAKVDTVMDRESIIYYITPEAKDGIYLYDIDAESTAEDVVDRFGLPNETTESERYISYCYSTEDVYLSYHFSVKSGMMDYFSLALSEEYLKGVEN